MNGIWGRAGKRIVDMVLAIALLPFLIPLSLALALLIRLQLGTPVLFTQQRLGRDAREFRLYKFRSMTNAEGPDGQPLPDDARLTRFGNALRSTSLDEIPQVFNILKGDMSFIGPRPTLPSYRALLLERYAARFTVLPGITSLAGVRGRNSLGWDQKFELDVEYVEQLSFVQDVVIFLKTIPTVLKRGGIAMEGSATASRYDQQANDPT